jgi:hypothetical protein
MYGVNNVMQTDIHSAEPSVPEPSSFEAEIAVEKFRRYELPGTDEIPAEGDNTLMF